MSPNPASSVTGAASLAGAWLCCPNTAIGKSSRIAKNRCLILKSPLDPTIPNAWFWSQKGTKGTKNSQSTYPGLNKHLCLLWLKLLAVLQLRHFRFAFSVNSNDEKIVVLSFVNRGNDIAAEHFYHVRNRIAVAHDEHALSCPLENLVGDLRRRFFRDLPWVGRIRFERKGCDRQSEFSSKRLGSLFRPGELRSKNRF